MSIINSSILSIIGNTPIVQLRRFFEDINFNLYAKLELLNPSGSAKDRPALNMVKNALKEQKINQDTTIIESSSGNLAIALAQVCKYYNMRLICVVDSRTTKRTIDMIKSFNAEVELVLEPDPVTGEYLPARINRVKNLLSEIDNSYWTNQYANTYNSDAHQMTMQEIGIQLNRKVDYLFCAVSTFGTIRGCVEYIRSNNLNTKVFAVDAIGSVIFGSKTAKRLIPGHGAAIRPQLFEPGLVDNCIYVSDADCIMGCRELVKKEAIFAGGSSGGVIKALEKVKNDIQKGSNCVVILHDRGDRYIDTIYSNEWVQEHFSNIYV